MASCNLSYSGATGVLQASASVSEVTTTGTQRKLHLSVFIEPIDYSGARTFGYNITMNGSQSGEGSLSIDGDGYTIYDSDFYVSLPYGSTSTSISFSFSATVVSPKAGNKTISGTITSISGLTLEQGSTTLSGAGGASFGGKCSVTWKPASSSMYYKLRFSLGSWSETTSAIYPGTTSTYTYSGYTIPLSAANQIPNSDSTTMVVTLYTYSNSACTSQVGSASSVNFTVTLPNNIIPSISGASIAADNSGNSVVASWGIAVSGFTKLHVTASASGTYGSTVARFIIEGAYEETVSGTVLDYTGGIIQSSGDKFVKVTCVDSRGRKSNTVTTSPIPFSSYSAPSVSQFTATRNASGYAVLNAIYAYNSVGNNSISAVVQYRKSGSDAWTIYGNIGNNVQLTTTIKMSDESSYTFKVVVTDSVGSSVEKTAFLSTAKVLLDFKKGGDGLGIGKICETAALEVAMDSIFYGNVKIGDMTLAQFIQGIMAVLPSSMYGATLPSSGQNGQIFFKKM